MENGKKLPQQEVGPTSTTPSLTSQLFGSQSSSSNDVFASIFSNSNKGIGRNSSLEIRGNGNQPWNASQDNVYRHGDTSYNSSASNDKNSAYHNERAEPSYLSSSLYYGGQETYSTNPSSTHHSTSTSYSTFKKDGGEDDSSGGAARGNWWQGSLYY